MGSVKNYIKKESYKENEKFSGDQEA